jgi:hypothetical protein
MGTKVGTETRGMDADCSDHIPRYNESPEDIICLTQGQIKHAVSRVAKYFPAFTIPTTLEMDDIPAVYVQTAFVVFRQNLLNAHPGLRQRFRQTSEGEINLGIHRILREAVQNSLLEEGGNRDFHLLRTLFGIPHSCPAHTEALEIDVMAESKPKRSRKKKPSEPPTPPKTAPPFDIKDDVDNLFTYIFQNWKPHWPECAQIICNLHLRGLTHKKMAIGIFGVLPKTTGRITQVCGLATLGRIFSLKQLKTCQNAGLSHYRTLTLAQRVSMVEGRYSVEVDRTKLLADCLAEMQIVDVISDEKIDQLVGRYHRG